MAGASQTLPALPSVLPPAEPQWGYATLERDDNGQWFVQDVRILDKVGLVGGPWTCVFDDGGFGILHGPGGEGIRVTDMVRAYIYRAPAGKLMAYLRHSQKHVALSEIVNENEHKFLPMLVPGRTGHFNIYSTGSSAPEIAHTFGGKW